MKILYCIIYLIIMFTLWLFLKENYLNSVQTLIKTIGLITWTFIWLFPLMLICYEINNQQKK